MKEIEKIIAIIILSSYIKKRYVQASLMCNMLINTSLTVGRNVVLIEMFLKLWLSL